MILNCRTYYRKQKIKLAKTHGKPVEQKPVKPDEPVESDKINRLADIVTKARSGDKASQDELKMYGLEWDEKPVKHRQIGVDEAELLLGKVGKVEAR